MYLQQFRLPPRRELGGRVFKLQAFLKLPNTGAVERLRGRGWTPWVVSPPPPPPLSLSLPLSPSLSLSLPLTPLSHSISLSPPLSHYLSKHQPRGSPPTPPELKCFQRSHPQKALCGGIPDPFLEPLTRSWSHFVGVYRQILTTSLKN